MDDYSISAMPIGFGMHLCQDRTAMEHFALLSDAEKDEIISYIQSSTSGEDAEMRVKNAIMRLH